jgi:S-DNA-T family DNA segregation ATPase FtsK/SpoIIIE
MPVADYLVIGREGDLVIADPEISRLHCSIRIVDGALVVDDLQSLNGTRVNGKRIHFPTLLAPGDMIGLGTSEIEVVPPTG